MILIREQVGNKISTLQDVRVHCGPGGGDEDHGELDGEDGEGGVAGRHPALVGGAPVEGQEPVTIIITIIIITIIVTPHLSTSPAEMSAYRQSLAQYCR